MSLNVLISDVENGYVLYEPVTGLLGYGELSYEAKDNIRSKIIELCSEDCDQIISKFNPSKRFEDTWLYVITMKKAMQDSGIDFQNIDVTSINLSVCHKKQQEGIMQESLECH